MMDHKKRWGIEDEPNWQRFFRKREVTHPAINKWDDFSDEDKKILSYIKQIIVSYLGDCNVCIYGSRTKGYWNEDSDYDIKIYKIPDDETKMKIKNHNWECKSDLSYVDSERYKDEGMIDIP